MAITKTIIIDAQSKQAQAEVQAIDSQLKNIDKDADKGSKGVKKVSLSFKALGIAMKAAGIGLIIGALAKLVEVFSQNQKVLDAFNIAMEGLSIAFNDFTNFVINKSGTVVNFFKAIFENPLKSVKALGASIKANIVERFESFLDTLGFLASAVKKVFSGDFAGALEDVNAASKETYDILTGVNNTVDKVTEFGAKAAKAVKNYAKETFNTAKANIALNTEAEKGIAINRLLIEQYDRQSELQRQIRDDETKTIDERIKANQKLGELLAEQEKLMLANASAQVKAAQAQFNKLKNDETEIALLEAKAEKEGVLAQITGLRSEQLISINSLDKEKIELTNSMLESESALLIERKRFNAEQIEDELERLEALKVIDLLEAEQETARLQAIVDNADAETQAKIDAQIALDDFTELSRQTNLTRDTEITEAQAALEKKKTAAKQKAVDDVISLAGAESKIGKALFLLKQGLALKEMIMEAKKTIAFGSIAAAKSGVALAEGTAQTAKVGFPQNIPLLIGYAAQAAGIFSAIKSATGKANSAASSFGGGSGGGGGGSAPQPPSFNVVGASDSNQLADAIGGQSQQPVQAFVVANDVTTAQSLQNNIVEGATIG